MIFYDVFTPICLLCHFPYWNTWLPPPPTAKLGRNFRFLEGVQDL